MANIKISDLTAAASVSGTQQFEVNEAGTSKKVTGAQIATYVEGEISSSPSFTGQASVAAGTAASPSITVTGDTNTGIYFPAADTVGISTGGTLRVSVDSSGSLVTAGTIELGHASDTTISRVSSGVIAVEGQVLATQNYVLSNTPAGSLMPFAGTTEPSGWFFCEGRSLSTTTYATLFAAIGYTYGGSGATFNIPDLRGRVIAGQDDMGGTSANRLTGLSGGVNGDTLGGTGGTEAHTLLTAETPAHQHFIANSSNGTTNLSSSNYLNDSASYTVNEQERYNLAGSANVAISGLTSSTGGGGAHNNIQPTIILNYIIKV